MARLRLSEPDDASDAETLYRDPSVIPQPTSVTNRPPSTSNIADIALSPSPAASSDKENQANSRPNQPTVSSSLGASCPDTMQRAPKRKRVAECLSLQPRTNIVDKPESINYDPNQDVDERRETRKGLRKIYKDVCDNKAEYLQPDSKGLHNALNELEAFQSTVKQTSDATIDSRTLVDVGDLTYKKAQRLVFGDASQGVDVDEFVSKCITFMRSGEGSGDDRDANAPIRQQMLLDNHDSDEEDGDQGDALDWAWLGSQACVQSNLRPSVSPFLLGPFSALKRARVQRLRRERLHSRVPVSTTQPQELKETDLERSENSNLVGMCRGVLSRLGKVAAEGQSAAAKEHHEDMSLEQEAELLQRHHMCRNEGVSLVDFAINPNSFGQTVENLFYISFLIKDGHVGVSNDEEGEISLHITASEEEDHAAHERTQRQRHHGVFSIDHAMWQELVRTYEIKKPLIPHRMEDEIQDGLSKKTGWY